MSALDAEQKRAIEEGLSEDELALFDVLQKENLGKAERERVKQASRALLALIKSRLAGVDRFWEKEQTKADVEVFILDEVYSTAGFRHRLSRRMRRIQSPLALCPYLVASGWGCLFRGRIEAYGRTGNAIREFECLRSEARQR